MDSEVNDTGEDADQPDPPWKLIPIRFPWERPKLEELVEHTSQGREALTIVKGIAKEADLCHQDGSNISALWMYHYAIEICRHYGLDQDALHIKCAAALFQLQNIEGANYLAYAHASECINTPVGDPEASEMCTRAMKEVLLNDQLKCYHNNFPDAVVAGCQCFGWDVLVIHANILCDAIAFAIEKECTQCLPKLQEQHLKLLPKLLPCMARWPAADSSHVVSLLTVFDMPADAIVNASSIQLADLIPVSPPGVSFYSFLEMLFELGMIVSTERGIEKIVELLGDEKRSILDLALRYIPEAVNLQSPIQLAIQLKKLHFLQCLLQQSAELHSFPVPTDLNPLIPEIMSADLDKNRDLLNLLCVLLECGADSSYMNVYEQERTTPVHIATRLALKTGNTHIIHAVMTNSSKASWHEKAIQDKKGRTPYHVVALSQTKKEVACKVCDALSHHPVINPISHDKPKGKHKHGKLPKQYLQPSNPLHQALVKAEDKFLISRGKPTSSKRIKKPTKKASPISILNTKTFESGSSQCPDNGCEEKGRKDPRSVSASASGPQITDGKVSVKEVKVASQTTDMVQPEEKSNSHTWKVSVKPTASECTKIPSMPTLSSKETVQAHKSVDQRLATQLERVCFEKDGHSKIVSEMATAHTVSPSTGHNLPESPQQLSNLDEQKESSQQLATQLAEPQLHMKLLMNTNVEELLWEVELVPQAYKVLKDRHTHPVIVRAALATICKLATDIRHNTKAVHVSPSGQGPHLYETKMTRGGRILWEKAKQFSPNCSRDAKEIIFRHVIRIWAIVPQHDKLSHQIDICKQQMLDSYKKGLKSQKLYEIIPSDPNYDPDSPMPITFRIKGAGKCEKYIPPASPKGDEFNIVPTYSFSTTFLKCVLDDEADDFDFPYRPYPDEYDIIRLPFETTVLLLGRSGTGKTTCLLHRLWKRFKYYWSPSGLGGCGMPARQRSLDVESAFCETFDADSRSNDYVPISEGIPNPAAIEATSLTSDIEHLRQVFVTKNHLLCRQVKDKFYSYARSHSFLKEHASMRKQPQSLTEVSDHTYPLFLTSWQFYFLLDKSLDGRKFFWPSSKDATKVPTVIREDYDLDPNTLLELEYEDETVGDPTSGLEANCTVPAQDSAVNAEKKPQEIVWIEVTALYFEKHIWRKIKKHSRKSLDPTLVWMEIKSFIKGSTQALSLQRPLTRDEYKKVGKKLAPHYASERDDIYRLYEAYKHYCKNTVIHHATSSSQARLFDECDLVLSLYKRICSSGNIPWLVHTFYIDEVQDFTQAELLLLFHCCQDPNGLFFTGDTAQAIKQGVSFRFDFLRTIFSKINKKYPEVQNPNVYELTINFRSHAGILKLSASVIDLLSEFFKMSFDSHLPKDEGIFQGPKPVLLDTCEADELALLLRSNKRETSPIEFGAHQAIIVRSKEARAKLPDMLTHESAKVLTIYEAKGLEFDDVLIYDFFADSPINKEWRVVTSYLHKHPEDNLNHAPVGWCQRARSLEFDESRHKSLNAELKRLYTASTRAKFHLWIFDSNPEKRLPMFDYWYKRQLAKLVSHEDGKDALDRVFATVSEPEQWKIQGDYFKGKRNWRIALQCYKMAGEDCSYLQREVEAFIHDSKSHHLEAAVSFLEADEKHHDVQYLENAAISLQKVKPLEAAELYLRLQKVEKAVSCLLKSSQYIRAAKLCESLGKDDQAFQAFRKAREWKECVRLHEKHGRYTDAVKVLLEEAQERIWAIKKAKEYEEKVPNVQLEEKFCSQSIALRYADRYARRACQHGQEEDIQNLELVLAYLAPFIQAKHWKQAKIPERALKIYKDYKMYIEAYRLLSGQGNFDDAIMLAKQQKDWSAYSDLILQKARAELHSQTKLTSLSLHGSSHHDDLTIAHIQLLLGVASEKPEHCIKARDLYFRLRQQAAELEAFNQMVKLKGDEYDPKIVFRYYCLAHKLGHKFEKHHSHDSAVQKALKFYCLELRDRAYCMPPDQDIWIKTLEKHQLQDGPYDLDGMRRLAVKKTEDEIGKHLKSLYRDYMPHSLESQLGKFQVYTKLLNNCNGDLPDHLYTDNPGNLMKYVQTLLICIQFNEMNETTCIDVGDEEKLVSHIFSPSLSLYLPFSYPISEQNRLMPLLRVWDDKYQDLKSKNADTWLMIWQVHCIANKSTSGLQRFLNYRFGDHCFSFWLESCQYILDGNALKSSELALEFCNIVSQHGFQIAVLNLVNILTIHCTILLGIIKICGTAQSRFLLPAHYKHCIDVFDILNTHTAQNGATFNVCFQQVCSNWQHCQDMASSAISQLDKMMELMVYDNKYFPPILRLAITDDDARAFNHCLVLTLVLFGNLVSIHASEPILQVAQASIRRILHEAMTEGCKELTTIYDAINSPISCRKIFDLVELLPLFGKEHAPQLVEIACDAKEGQIGRIYFSDRLSTLPSMVIQSPEHAVRSDSYEENSQSLIQQNFLTPAPRVQTASYAQVASKQIQPKVIPPPLEGHAYNIHSAPQLTEEDNHRFDFSSEPIDDWGYCLACGIQLVLRSEVDFPEDQEIFEEHTQKELHATNSKLFNKFNEEIKSTYEPLCKEVEEALSSLEGHADLSPHLKANNIESGFQMMVEQNSTAINKIKQTRNWREGLTQLRNMLDRIQSIASDLTESLRRVAGATAEITHDISLSLKHDMFSGEQESNDDYQLERIATRKITDT